MSDDWTNEEGVGPCGKVPTGRVVVGVDATVLPQAPLRQALHEAQLRGALLEIVSVWSYPPMSTEERMLTTASALESETIERVGESVAQLRSEGRNNELTIGVDVVQGAPGKVLVGAAEGSDLLVVGRHDNARLRHLVLGSVADQCVRHAPVPVMVVPPDWDQSEHPEPSTLVVGMDFSDMAHDALRWALDEAALRGAAVRVVHCWVEPMLIGGDLMMALPPGDALERDAVEALQEYLDGLEVPEGVTVTGETRHGSPGYALLEGVDDASMIVVGSRGRGGFAGLLLGSVARRVTRLAPCPIVVLR